MKKTFRILFRRRSKKGILAKKIFGVTEDNSEVGLDYRIVLEDEKRWYHVNSDESGNLHLFKKYKKA